MSEADKINQVVDLADLRERLEGDKELFLDVAEAFMQDFPVQLEEIVVAINQNNIEKIKTVAHTIKGALSNLSVKRGAQLARELENNAASIAASAMIEIVEGLKNELKLFQMLVEEIENGSRTF